MHQREFRFPLKMQTCKVSLKGYYCYRHCYRSLDLSQEHEKRGSALPNGWRVLAVWTAVLYGKRVAMSIWTKITGSKRVGTKDRRNKQEDLSKTRSLNNKYILGIHIPLGKWKNFTLLKFLCLPVTFEINNHKIKLAYYLREYLKISLVRFEVFDRKLFC